jgi:serine protease SohB
VLLQTQPGDEIMVKVESPGGMVHGYGLAASQLQRIRDAKVPLTIAVDKVAASGGYMMACVADRIIAAPFAVLGSIGVLAQLPNFHKLLKKNDIDFELLTAGEYKRTLTMFGENTDKGREKFVEELEETHDLFKEFVQDNRPSLDVAKVATGEVWYGRKAIDVGLIDELQTSDAFVQGRLKDWDVFEVKFVHKKNWQEKLGLAAESALEKSFLKIFQRGQQRNSF